MGPSNSEDPEDRKARLRERRLSLLENRRAAEKTSTGLTTDLGSVYGLQSLSMFGQPGKSRASAAPAPQPASTPRYER
jgi:hypothetical protein